MSARNWLYDMNATSRLTLSQVVHNSLSISTFTSSVLLALIRLHRKLDFLRVNMTKLNEEFYTVQNIILNFLEEGGEGGILYI